MIRRDWLRSAGSAALALSAAPMLSGRTLSASRRPPGPKASPTPLFALRNPGCGCCEGWANHLSEHDFEVDLHDSPALSTVKDRLGIPEDLHGCHTGMVEGYLVEGHVPAEFIRRMLDEAPEIAGIAVPGMPIGSPGMEGPDAKPYDVIAFGGEGEAERYVFGTATPA